MPTAEERDEQDAQDPFARSLKEPGYRIAARIERPPDRRPQVVTALTAAAIVVAIVVAALRLQVDQTAALPTPRPLASGLEGRIATQLPALVVHAPSGTVPRFPVLSGGLRWLDPSIGSLSGPPFSGARGWILGGADGGAICVCFDSPWSATGVVELTTIARYDPTGTEVSRTTIDQIDSAIRTGDSILRDVARSADGTDLYLASARRDDTGWAVRLDRIEPTAGPSRAVQVGDQIGREDLDWLVDAGSGRVYRWSRFSHVIAALTVATGDVVARTIDPGPAGLAGVGTDAAVPAARDGRAIWAQLRSAADVPRNRLAGSIDGTLVYAIGVAAGEGTGVSGPLFASTGIWAFDPQTLGIVQHWPAAAMYDEIATSPDGRFVFAVGLEGMTADGRLADWDSSLVIHDAGDGRVIEQIGQLVGDEGFFVDLLAPGPVP